MMPRMPGLLLSDPEVVISLTPKDRLSMAQAMAENLARQQELTWPYPGAFDLASGTIRPFPGAWAAWVAQDVRHWLERARAHSDRTTESDINWVEQVLNRAHDALTEPFVASFVMHDYTEMNVAFEHTSSDWRVSGMFDLMEAFFGDGELDLARQTIRYISEAPELAHAFVRRYLQLHPARAGFTERFQVYMLWDRLVVWEFFQQPQRETPWEPALTLRMWLEPIVEDFDPGTETWR